MTLYTNHLVRNIYGDIDYTQQEKFENIAQIKMTKDSSSRRKEYYWLDIITNDEKQFSIEMSTKDDTWWIEQ